ncbi:unnamed protein product [Linum trigynum]|uniref:Uncharacterized protein n=1 Tax=Linum trigynum TaxID=586398 RepID=A0AAV2CIF8_9ROSI
MRSDTSESYARNCVPGSIENAKVNGTIVLCENKDPDYSGFGKVLEMQYNGGVGVIFIDDLKRRVASTFKDFPAVVISSKDATEILSYINSTKNPVATILATVATPKYKPAPEIAYFSARGIAAVVKSHNPSFGPSEIKSAIMTTASQLNNDKSPITTHSGATATPFDYGAGEMSPTAPLQPGLVYETTTVDYLNFLCYHGYNTNTIKLIAKSIPPNFACPNNSTPDLISDINYPSISAKLNKKQSRNVATGDCNSIVHLINKHR